MEVMHRYSVGESEVRQDHATQKEGGEYINTGRKSHLDLTKTHFLGR